MQMMIDWDKGGEKDKKRHLMSVAGVGVGWTENIKCTDRDSIPYDDIQGNCQLKYK